MSSFEQVTAVAGELASPSSPELSRPTPQEAHKAHERIGINTSRGALVLMCRCGFGCFANFEFDRHVDDAARVSA